MEIVRVFVDACYIPEWRLYYDPRWRKISDPRSVTEILKQVYSDHTTEVDEVYSRIIETTQHPAAAASFASIMFAPQGQLTFKEALDRSGAEAEFAACM